MAHSDSAPTPLLRQEQAAELLGVRPATLEAWRRRGIEPPLPFVRCGRSVRYRREALLEWIEARTSTRAHVATVARPEPAP